MKAKLIFSLLLILPIVLSAQNRNRMDDAIKDFIHKKREPTFIKDQNITGDQYFKKEFSLGKILVGDKEISTNYALRYNAYKDEVEINNDLIIDYLIKDRKVSCLIGDDKFVYQIFSDTDNDTNLGYLSIIFDGNDFSLLARKIKKLKEAKVAKTSLTRSFPAKLVPKEKFYYSDKSKNMAILIKNNKTLLKLINQNFKSEMKSFLKENHINIKKEKDLILFFKHCNSLSLKQS